MEFIDDNFLIRNMQIIDAVLDAKRLGYRLFTISVLVAVGSFSRREFWVCWDSDNSDVAYHVADIPLLPSRDVAWLFEEDG
jgi:hypothetical protein